MKNIIFTYLIFILFIANIFAQSENVPPHRTCGTVEYMKQLMQKYPYLREKMKKQERIRAEWIKNYNKERKNCKDMEDDIYIIPVVVHVIWNTDAQNISDAQVLSQIQVLNEDFRKLNADNSNLAAEFQNISADIEIEFCLATRNPDDEPSNGITRTQTNITEFSADNNFMKYTNQGGKDAWDTDKYLNLWVCKIGGGLLGYAQLPGGPPESDGVVIGTTNFGSNGANLNAPYDLGRTATHEIGHWLSLLHVWGDDNGACTGTDNIDDTPNQGNMYYGCPSHPQTSCGSNDMFQNYMDYVDDGCMVTFTEGQKTAMRAVLNNERSGLLNSLGCLGTGSVFAFFGSNPSSNDDGSANGVVSILTNEFVEFIDTSVFDDTNPIASWEWTFEGGEPVFFSGQYPPPIQYNSVGEFEVVLTIVGEDEEHESTRTKTDYIHVTHISPTVDFTCNGAEIFVHDTINFSNLTLSTSANMNYAWEFPGGQPENSTEEYPTVLYDLAGNYPVKLTVSDGYVTVEKEIELYILVKPDPPRANFTHTSDAAGFAIIGQTVDFTDLTTGGDKILTSWEWEFENAVPQNSTEQNPERIFFPEIGRHSISLTVRDELDSVNIIFDTLEIKNGQFFGQIPSYYCDTISNIEKTENSIALHTITPWGWVPGHNQKEVNKYIDAYINELKDSIFINGFAVPVFESKPATPYSTVFFNVYNKDTVSIFSQEVRLTSLTPKVYNMVNFDETVIVTDNYFLGFEISYEKTDTFAIYMAENRGKNGRNTVYTKRKFDDKWLNLTEMFAGSLISNSDTLVYLTSSLGIEPLGCETGINDIKIGKNEILVYPNPSQDKVNIFISDIFFKDVKIKIYDSIGNLIISKNQKTSNNIYQIDFSNQSSGIYFINVKIDDKKFTKKVSIIK